MVRIKVSGLVLLLILLTCGFSQAVVPDGLTPTEWRSIREPTCSAGYYFTRFKSKGGLNDSAYRATNQAHDWHTDFTAGTVEVVSGRSSGEMTSLWKWILRLTGYGYARDIKAVATAPEITVKNNRLTYRWDNNLTEWYINDARGLEQGFTILSSDPLGDGEKGSEEEGIPLQIDMAVNSSLTPQLTDKGQSILFKDKNGDSILRYGSLYVTDAEGQTLPSHMQVSTGKGESFIVHLIVDDTDATYPISIDPILSNEVVKLRSAAPVLFGYFGESVAIEGDALLVGELNDKSNESGAVYIFERNQGGTGHWGLVKTLTASDAEIGDAFGDSIGISGDVIVAGARGEDDGGDDAGAAYIFGRDVGGLNNWGEVRKIAPSDPGGGDRFGSTIAISGDTMVVGAPMDSHAGGNLAGSAYIFQQDQGGAGNWGEVKKLTASDSKDYGYFGHSVTISSDIAVVGGFGTGAGAIPIGSAYIFGRNVGGNDNWGEVKIIRASDPAADDSFGASVSINGETIIVGASGEDEGGSNAGAAYIFERNLGGPDNWGEVKKLVASDASDDDNFAISVSLNGDRAVVGAWNDDDDGVNAGSAYIFERNLGGPDNWGEVKKLVASDPEDGAFLGTSVAIDGTTAVAGAPFDDEGAGNAGSAYVYSLVDNTPPTVSSTSPADGTTGVEVNTAITATFSEDMNPSSITTTTFTVSGGVTGTVSYEPNTRTAKFVPSPNLSNSVTYTATITTGATDLEGNRLESDYTWSFTIVGGDDDGNCFISTGAF